MINRLPSFYNNYCISSGTLRDVDLFGIFITEIHNFMAYCQLDKSTKDYIFNAIENLQAYLTNEEELSSNVELAFNILESIAPEGCYFGSHPGDGACFGFWTIEE